MDNPGAAAAAAAADVVATIHFINDWASLLVGSKFTIFALFYLVCI